MKRPAEIERSGPLSVEPTTRMAADAIVSPIVRNAQVVHSFGSRIFGGPKPSGDEVVAPMLDVVRRADDLSVASQTLAAQAVSLDAIFTELARRASDNLSGNPDIVDRYLRLALKAQSSCRSTLEALAKLHQPREQIVKHVHVSDGGQAVVADHFHHHAGGGQNDKDGEQPHAARTGTTGAGSSLLGTNTLGIPVPSPSREGMPAMPNARRKGQRGAARK